MVNISLLEMGRTKKRGVREAIIEILSREFPLSIKKVYGKIKKEYSLGVTYQAVFKVIKEMLAEGMLDKKEGEYLINIRWINELENELNRIKSKYSGEAKEPHASLQVRINKFISKLGPKIKEYISDDKACIIGVSGGGKIFAMALWKYLLIEGLDVKFSELSWIDQANEESPFIKKDDIENRKVVLVDSEIYSGKTYEVVMKKFNRLKNKLKIKDIRFIADKDIAGLADFSVLRG